MNSRKVFLFSGLSILFVAFVVKWMGVPLCYFKVLLGIAILLKSIFLLLVFREKGFKPSLWLLFILAGVALMLFSLLFKEIFPLFVLNRILFYGAITLKVSGLVLMLLSQRRKKGHDAYPNDED